MKDKDKLQALRRGMTVAAAALATLQADNGKVMATQMSMEKQPQAKEVVAPDTTKPTPIPNDTIAPFGIFSPEGNLTPPIDSIAPDTVNITPVDKTPYGGNKTESSDFEYTEEAISFIENYETVKSSKKDGSMNKDDLSDAKFDLYEEALTINILQTLDKTHPLVKTMADSFEKVDSITTVMSQYSPDSPEFKMAHKQLRPIAQELQKNTKNPIKDILKIAKDNKKMHKELSEISTSDNQEEAFFNSKKADKFINNTYKDAVKYIQEKNPEYFQAKKQEKTELREGQREDRKNNQESNAYLSKYLRDKSNS